APVKYVQMHPAMRLNVLGPWGFSAVIKRPIARLPVVKAAVLQAGQHLQHGPDRGSHQAGPARQLKRRQLAALPYRPRRVDDQVAAVLPVTQDSARADQGAAGAGMEGQGNGESLSK